MDFVPTETQRLLGDAVSALMADRHDFETRQRRLATGATHDAGLWAEMAALGLPGVEIPEVHGGSGGDFEDLASLLEPFGAALATEPFIPSIVLSADLLLQAGSPKQQAKHVPRLAAGEMFAAVAHDERRARNRLSFVETTAVRVEAGWRLDGAKAVIPAGDLAGLFILSARTSGAADAPEGLSLFLVSADAVGLERRAYGLYDGSGAADLLLEDLRLPAEALLGVEGQAFGLIARAWDRGAAAVCVEAVGVMTALRDMTLDYIRTREQFGQPIGRFQVLQHRMADLHMAVELSRSMALLAVDAVGDPDPGARARKISAAKHAIASACREVGHTAVQLHGGVALTDEYAAGHFFKRLTMIARQFGDADHHLSRYAALTG